MSVLRGLAASLLVGFAAFTAVGCEGNAPQPAACSCCGGAVHPGGGGTPPPANPQTRYTCPMHPDVVQSAPGNCPRCGMALVATQ